MRVHHLHDSPRMASRRYRDDLCTVRPCIEFGWDELARRAATREFRCGIRDVLHSSRIVRGV